MNLLITVHVEGLRRLAVVGDIELHVCSVCLAAAAAAKRPAQAMAVVTWCS